MESIQNILIVGAGTMGHGIAQVFAQGGYRVTLQDIVPHALERAGKLIKSSLSTLVEAGLIQQQDIKPTLDHIKLTTSLEEGSQDADLAIECIVENKAAKIDLFQKLDKSCPPKTLLASNSSFLNIFEFVETSRPEKVMIIHMYAPPQIIPLVDIVKGPRTNEVYVQTMVGIFRAMGKKPIVFNKPLAGYLVSRLQVAFQREVFWMLDNDYLSPKDIDESAIWGLAMRMVVVGICQRIDFGGLDLSARTLAQAPAQSTPVDYQPQKLMKLLEEGALGVKAGRGYYDYKGKTEAEICHERDIRLLKLLKFLQENNLAGPIIFNDKSNERRINGDK